MGMKIYFNTLIANEKLKALYLLSDLGSFYAEPINDGVIGDSLLYNDYMFHFEGNPDRTKIILKDSENYITDALVDWLKKHSDINFISVNDESFKALSGISKLDMADYHQTIINKDLSESTLIDGVKKLKEICDAKG